MAGYTPPALGAERWLGRRSSHRFFFAGADQAVAYLECRRFWSP